MSSYPERDGVVLGGHVDPSAYGHFPSHPVLQAGEGPVCRRSDRTLNRFVRRCRSSGSRRPYQARSGRTGLARPQRWGVVLATDAPARQPVSSSRVAARESNVDDNDFVTGVAGAGIVA